MLKQFGAFLKAKDETISALQQQIMTFENNRLTREAIRNYEDAGKCGFHFHLDDVRDVLGTFVFPHISDLSEQQYFEKLDIACAKSEDLCRAILMVTELLKQVRNKIFSRNLCDNYVSTLLRELSA